MTTETCNESQTQICIAMHTQHPTVFTGNAISIPNGGCVCELTGGR